MTLLGDDGGTGPLGQRNYRRMEDSMDKNKTPARPGKALRKPGLAAALMLTVLSLSACVVPVDGDHRGDGHRRHHWNNDGDWNSGPDTGWHGGGHHWH
ncbi:hypothetical protein [Dongia sedimenti]|uniref:Lipoprotein n=1 Tax=Dongia sedimenti TaxID=3064282 RepID=A0ABU0YFI7_9PROT|nr:hypothetical protein [Rhodospirillaceae bacterium R-7]